MPTRRKAWKRLSTATGKVKCRKRTRILPSARLLCALAALAATEGVALSNDQWLAFIGTYTGEKSRGIYVSRFDAQTGGLSPADLPPEARHPPLSAVHPT